MIEHAPFPKTNWTVESTGLKTALAKQNLDGVVIASPENIYYLTGMDHWGILCGSCSHCKP